MAASFGPWHVLVVAAALILHELALSVSEAIRQPVLARWPHRVSRPTSIDSALALVGKSAQLLAMLALCATDLKPLQGMVLRSSATFALGATLLSALVVWIVEPLLRSRIRPANQRFRDYVRALASYWPRRHHGRCLVVAGQAVGSISEELIVRGVFVGVVWQLSGSLSVASLVGFVISLGLHVYQGRRHLLFHAVFFLLALALFLRVGLIGAMAFHVLYNVVIHRIREKRHFMQLRGERRVRVS